jgi:hypothetical protein
MLTAFRKVLETRYRLQEWPHFQNAVLYETVTPACRYTYVVCPLERLDRLALVVGGTFDELLAVSMLAFLMDRQDELSGNLSVTKLVGFTCAGYQFDAVLVLGWDSHHAYDAVDEALSKATLQVWPIYRCEFTGHETPEEVDLIVHRGPCLPNWTRGPCPLVYIRVRNRKTGVQIRRKHYTDSAYALHELNALPADPKSHVELENYLGQKVIATNQGTDYVARSADKAHERAIRRGTGEHWLKEFLEVGLTAE